MGTSRRPAVETPTLSDGREEDADLSCSPRFPPRPRLHRSPGKTEFDPGPSTEQEPEPELSEHEILHRQPGDRLRCLGSCSWSWYPVLRQPGVQPVQEQGRHEERQHQQSDLRQLQHRQRDPRIPWRICRCHRRSERRSHPKLWVNSSLVNSNFCKRKLCLLKHHVDLALVQKLF